MATRKSTKTSKTAHVLNLLTDVGDAKEEEKTPVRQEKPVRKPAAAPRPAPSPAVESLRAGNEAIESKIRAALEETTHMEVRSVPLTPPVSQEEQPHEAASQEDAEDGLPEEETLEEENRLEELTEADVEETVEPMSEAPSAEPAEEITPPVKQNFAATLEQVAEEASGNVRQAETEEREDVMEEHLIMPQAQKDIAVEGEVITCVNVMQALVEEKADKYISMFGLCNCQRCRIDVIALALTKLPSKYVVSKKKESIPMLTIYESRYSAAVISQVIWACKQVMDSPRHDL